MRPCIPYLIVLLCFPSIAGERVLLETLFLSEDYEARMVEGSTRRGEAGGLILEGDSRMRFRVPEGAGVHDGTVVVRFKPPDLGSSKLLPTLSSPDDCYCALKVRTGLCEIELSDRWLRAQRFSTKTGAVDTILAQENLSPNRQEVMELALDIRDGVVLAALNGTPRLKAAGFEPDFRRIDLATYRHPFELSELTVAALTRDTLLVDKATHTVETAAIFRPGRFNRGTGLKNHHFVVWEGGRAGRHALFATYASDSTIHQALVAAGAEPGNNLTQETWDKRNDPSSEEPDRKTRGSRVSLEILYGHSVYKPGDILVDTQGNPYRFRFAGNLDLIPQWRSGCVVCLQSCPGGKIGNATYSVRDLVREKTSFSLNKDVPFEKNEEVTLRFLVEEPR